MRNQWAVSTGVAPRASWETFHSRQLSAGEPSHGSKFQSGFLELGPKKALLKACTAREMRRSQKHGPGMCRVWMLVFMTSCNEPSLIQASMFNGMQPHLHRQDEIFSSCRHHRGIEQYILWKLSQLTTPIPRPFPPHQRGRDVSRSHDDE